MFSFMRENDEGRWRRENEKREQSKEGRREEEEGRRKEKKDRKVGAGNIEEGRNEGKKIGGKERRILASKVICAICSQSPV